MIKKKLRIKIKNQNIEGQLSSNIELKGKIEKKNQIHKIIQNKKKNKEYQFVTNAMIMNKICKHNKKYLKPSNPTFKTYDIYHEAEPRHKRQT